MVMINRATKEITLKIVYYGPGLCGKTTNLEFIYAKSNPEKRGKLLTVATETDRTLFFDFLPMELGTILGMKLRVQLYTVPGQVFYDATRRIVLRGSDGVVFVADSQKLMMDANWESLENMKKNLVLNNMNPDVLPLVFQYNKRDLPTLATVDELEQALNWRGVPHFEAVATAGKGVNETVRKIIEMVIRRLHEQEASLKHPQRSTEVPPSPVLPVPPQAQATTSAELAPVEVLPAVEDTSEEMVGVEVETEFSVGPGSAPPPPLASVPEKAQEAEGEGAAPQQPPAPSDFPLLEMPAKVEPLPELEEATGDGPVVVMEAPAGVDFVAEDLPESAIESEEGEALPEEAVQAEALPEVPVQAEALPEVPVQAEALPEVPVQAEALPEVPIQEEVLPEAPVLAEVLLEVPVQAEAAGEEQLPEFAIEVEVSGGLEELPPPTGVDPAGVEGSDEVSVEVEEGPGPTQSISAEVASCGCALDDLLHRLRGIVSELEDLKVRMADIQDRLPK